MPAPADAVPSDASQPVLAPGVGRVIVLLALTVFGSAMALRATDAAIPRLADDFHVSIRQASYVITAFALAYGLLQVVFGPSGDRFGKLQVIFVACVSGALASVACAVATDFDVLLISRAWAGASMASMVPLSLAWIGDNVAYAHRQAVLARFLVGQMSGIAVGQATGGLAADLLSWRAPFVALAMWFVVMSVLMYRTIRMPAFRTPPRTAPAGNAFAQCWSVLQRPWARRVLLTVFVEGGALYGPFAFFATHLHLKHGLSLGYAGVLLIAFAIGGITFSFASGRLIGIGEVALARAGALSMFLGVSLVALGPASWPAVSFALPGMFAMGLGYYMLHNTLQTNATQMAPEIRGTALAMFSSAFFLGQSGGVALCAAMVELFGTTAVIEGGATVLLLGGMAFALLRSRRQP